MSLASKIVRPLLGFAVASAFGLTAPTLRAQDKLKPTYIMWPNLRSWVGSDPHSLRKGIANAFTVPNATHKIYFLTAAHVVAGADRFEMDGFESRKITKSLKKIRVLGISETYDLAVLEAEVPPELSASMVSLAVLKDSAARGSDTSAGLISPFVSKGSLQNWWWKLFGDRKWPFRTLKGLGQSPIYPFAEWIEIQDTDLRPGMSGFMAMRLAESSRKAQNSSAPYNHSYPVMIFTKILADSRLGAGIPVNAALALVPSLMKGEDPWRKHHPQAPYIHHTYFRGQGWIRQLVLPAGYVSAKTRVLSEVCAGRGFTPAAGGDWRDGDGAQSTLNLFFTRGKAFRPSDKCPGRAGLMLGTGHLVIGQKTSQGLRDIAKIEDLNLERMSAERMKRFFDTVVIWDGKSPAR